MSRQPLIEMTPETLDTATGDVLEMLSGAKRRLGFVPNMYGYMARMPAVLGGYLSAYEAFRNSSGFSPAEQETVFLTISRVNGCSYCMAAHSMIADRKSGVPAESLSALRAGESLPDQRLNAVSVFTEAMVLSRGAPGKEHMDAFLAAGFEEQHVLGIVLAIACKTFSNYVNHLAGTPVDEAFASYAL